MITAVKVGDRVRAGDVLASLDCDKAVFDMSSPADGVVETLYAKPGETIAIGSPLLAIRPSHSGDPARRNAASPVVRIAVLRAQ